MLIEAFQPLDAPVPDDLTVPQFFLDPYDHPLKPPRPDDVTLFIDGPTGQRVSWAEARQRTAALANGMHLQWEIKEDEAVCIFSPNHIDYLTVVWAIHRLGGVVSSSNPTYTTDELVHQLKITKVTTVFVHPAFLKTVRDACQKLGIPDDRIALISPAPPSHSHLSVNDLIAKGSQQKQSFVERRLSPGEAKKKLAFFVLSSGTTGPPKAVAIPHYSLIVNVIQIASHDILTPGIPPENKKTTPGSVMTGVLPFFHIYGLISNVHSMIFHAVPIVVHAKFAFQEFLDSIVRHRITHLMVVPPMIVLLCKHPLVKKYDLSHVRFLNSGAAPLSPELLGPLSEVLPNAIISQGYGMTETATAVTMTPITERMCKPGSAGHLVPGVKMRIVKEDGSLAKFGERGELIVYSPSNAIGYYGNDKATKETFIDGWVRTGDEVEYTESGDLYIVDRLKDLIKVRGFQVAPAELEGHLLDHPAVADVCVVPVPDEYSGELPFAFVVLHAEAAKRVSDPKEAAALKKALEKHVSDVKIKYKWLSGGIEFTDTIPKNASGKLLRRLLKDKAKQLRKEALAEAATRAKL
ncbi:hypothetical protein EVG20_g591 [Dentipellis fragilis]|uniref:AMP-dependent synthetase/ligase domain-containing protein n=1 Tax=Dentipellis fragilis TaxID=205917 RepID=A0A4Y9ZG54_9AGAM|nr:hypothetical protein EVG20_g591 [Dentipellis fragilis]